jgi:flagellar biosynthesis/type III secretory pathway protein FliH
MRPGQRPDAPAPSPTSWALEELDPSAGHSVVFNDAPPLPSIDVDEIARVAYERGLEEGRRAGEAAEAARLQPTILALNAALATLQDEAAHWIGNAQENICALSIAVAREVIGREVQAEADVVDALVRQALLEFPLDQSIVVRMHPADLAVINTLKATMGAARPSPVNGERPEVQWLSDARILRGGCVIEGRDRIIDGRIDTALERLYRRVSQTDA